MKVPFNEARYGRNEANTIFLVRDALAFWVDAKMADDGDDWPLWKVRRYLKTFDELDRYDFDEDGDFNEPDGYIDHFQIVHAGADESDGDPVYGIDAIWAHKRPRADPATGTGPGGDSCDTASRPRVQGRRRTRARVAPPAASSTSSRTTRPACGSTTTPCSPRTAA